MFGPGLNRAHHLESKVARYPRILLVPGARHDGHNLGLFMDRAAAASFAAQASAPVDWTRWRRANRR